jgi:5-(carboxyamino)imidazole ribonucleotide synthase
MLAMAAAQLGYKCHIYAPDEAPPAAEVSARFTRGDWTDEAALARFGGQVDVATYEFENIAAGPLAALAAEAPLFPAAESARHRAGPAFGETVRRRSRRLPRRIRGVDTPEDLEAALAKIGTPAILKTRRFGYDGKGQARIMAPSDAGAAWGAVRGAPSILEAFVDFDAEFSILLCRSASGETVTWDAPRNSHLNGILHRSEVPAGPEIADAASEAEALARKIADALDYVGLLTLEFFASGGRATFNEMAPRVHNSGHWTIEGALTSQFENHIRASAGCRSAPPIWLSRR